MYPVTTKKQINDSSYFLNFRYMLHKDFCITPLTLDMTLLRIYTQETFHLLQKWPLLLFMSIFKLLIRWTNKNIKHKNPQSMLVLQREKKITVKFAKIFGK